MKRARPRGFTVVEIIVAMVLTLAVFAITLPFVRAQTRALGVSAGRLDADQLARYAACSGHRPASRPPTPATDARTRDR
jgi:Tfp pilus assembly protein PilW